MQHFNIVCDACKQDLTYTYNCVDYRLALVVEPREVKGPTVTAMHVLPPLDRGRHFCGLACLKKWINKE